MNDDKQPLVKKEGDKHGNSEAHANANVGVGTFLAIAAFALSVLAIGMEVSGGFQDRTQLLAAQRENARLNTLLLNHTDKLDDDTIVAQGLLTAANAALAGCKK